MKYCYSLLTLILASLFLTSCRNDSMFISLPSSKTHINFANTIVENDSINPIDLEFLYNGGGVAAGDFNNDGLQDLYFTASLVSNKLYLNKGNLQFEDITASSGTGGEGRWSNGASVVDINGDGWLDIYVCATIYSDPARRKNLLYINQGNDVKGVPHFKEMAAAYGLDNSGFSVQAAFFDYDKDGDLDMYLLQTKLVQRDAVVVRKEVSDSAYIDADRLFRNDWSDSLQHPVFTDVSRSAGITEAGYGLGLTISDLNGDGWPDIYVTNDFYDNDQLYINNQNGSFSEKVDDYFKHTSMNAMGNDIADVNGDGLPDVIAVDMNPESHFRKQKNMSPSSYYLYQNMVGGERKLQYVRNTLQLNLGAHRLKDGGLGDPVFAEIGYMAGVAETDWSWNPSIADFDNDGQRDIIITNGYPKDVTDHDFVAYRTRVKNLINKDELSASIPEIKVSNYAFKGNADLSFANVTAAWGMTKPSFSNGAVYVDLDNDGDLDYVINNINEEAFVYKNTSRDKASDSANYLAIKFSGEKRNRQGLGSKVWLYYNGQQQLFSENNPVRGYLSCEPAQLHFGLGKARKADSIVVQWNSGLSQVLRDIAVNQTVEVRERDAREQRQQLIQSDPLFREVTSEKKVQLVDDSRDFIDFDQQRLLPHKFSEYGPAIAAGDMNGDGLDDLCIGGSTSAPAQLLFQQKDGSFRQSSTSVGQDLRKFPETAGILMFDVDLDGDLDLYLASGSVTYPAGSPSYQDQLLINDGKGNFTLSAEALPQNFTSKSCVKAADFDNDNDLDIFVGGRVLPGRYPQAVSSKIYRNDSRNGSVKFTDVTAQVAPYLQNIGLICDALWTDFDNDGWKDLVICGEWQSINFLHNEKGKLKNTTPQNILAKTGWWNSIAGGDFDNDGDIDYVAGNLGLNSYLRATVATPLTLYAGDFMHNGSHIPLLTQYLAGEDGRVAQYPVALRDEITGQLPVLKKKFPDYNRFAKATIVDLLNDSLISRSQVLEANFLESAFLENLGNGQFAIKALPPLAQTAPLFGMVVDDVNADGNLDIVAVGNDFGTAVSIGRYDAMNGLVLLGDGGGNFRALDMSRSGIYIPGNGKGCARLKDNDGGYLLGVTQHKGALQLYEHAAHDKIVAAKAGDQYAIVKLKNGKERREEFYWGSSFYSQSANYIIQTPAVVSVTIKK
jgi:enediyne biosynthesis protein E4